MRTPDSCHLRRQAVLAEMDGLPSQSDAPFHAPAELVLNLPMPPTTNNLCVNIGRKRGHSPEYRAWIKHAGYLLNLQRPPQIAGRVKILIEVSDAESGNSWDVCNREKATTDLLVSHKIIPDDSKAFVEEVTMRWANVAGVRVTVRACE